MENIDFQKWTDLLIEYGSDYGLKLIGAFLIWIIGSWLIKKIKRLLVKAMDRLEYDESLEIFISKLIVGALRVLLIVVILGNLGVETTSFAALLAAAGLAVGLALQGSLSNFAGGVLIMIFKPYKMGDYIEAQGENGTVKEISIFTTKLNSPDNKEIIIPNGILSNGNITNYSTEKQRRVDLVIGVSYDADIKQTKELLMKIITDHSKTLSDPAPVVNVRELGDSSVNFNVRPWVLTDDYWTVYVEVLETCKLELDAAGIEIPYPHQVQIRKQG
jgi:small conductance mechanosensitive channel